MSLPSTILMILIFKKLSGLQRSARYAMCQPFPSYTWGQESRAGVGMLR